MAGAAALLLSGCSYLGGSPYQTMYLQADPPTADLYVNNEYVGTGSATPSVRRGESLTIRGSAPGYLDHEEKASKTLSREGKIDVILFPLVLPLIGLTSENAWAHEPDSWQIRLRPEREIAAAGDRVANAYSGRTALPQTGVSYASGDPARFSMPQAQRTITPPPTIQLPSTPIAPIEAPAPHPGASRNHALLIGISRYAHANDRVLPNLDSAANDARAMHDYLINDLGWQRQNVKLLTDEDATLMNVKVALGDWLALVDEDDTLVFFWAGHGYGSELSNENRLFFAVHDTRPNQPSSGLEMGYVRDAIKNRNPRHVIAFLDTCHSGGFINTRSTRTRAIGPMVSSSLRQDIPPGWIYFAGAQTDKVAYEVATLRNGLFTHYLLQGLRGAADGIGRQSLRDATITMAELSDYLQEVAPNDSLARHGVPLDPRIETDSYQSAIWEFSF